MLQAILGEAIDLWLRENGKHPFGGRWGRGGDSRVAWTPPTLVIHRCGIFCLDLTDATLDLTDKTAVIPWTLPTNLITETNILPNSRVGRVQASIAEDSRARLTIWARFIH
jgi:hypothetical protein